MDFEQALRGRLKADAGIAAVVASRVDWHDRPQAAAYPAIVLIGVSDARPRTLTTYQTRRATRVQIECLGETHEQKVAVREAALAVIKSKATFGGVRFGRAIINDTRNLSEEGETRFIHRDSIDATIWHNG